MYKNNFEPWYFDIRKKSAVIFSSNDRDEQKMLFLVRFSKNENQYIINNILSCTIKYSIKYLNFYHGEIRVRIFDGIGEFDLVISNTYNTVNEYGFANPIFKIYTTVHVCIEYGYYNNYPVSEEGHATDFPKNTLQQTTLQQTTLQQATLQQATEVIGKYKNVLDFIQENNILDENKLLKDLEDKLKKKLSFHDKLISIKKNINELNSKIVKEKNEIDNEIDQKITCKICFTNTCESVLYCGHFMCKDCIQKVKKDDVLVCPYCKKNVETHSIFV